MRARAGHRKQARAAPGDPVAHAVARGDARIRRRYALGSLALLIGAGLAVHLLLPDTTGSDIAGDALYAVAIYSGVVLLAPRMRRALAALIAAGWCIGVELLQLTGIPLRAGHAFPPAALVFGTVFDPRDLVVYPLAVAVAWLVDARVTAALDRNG